MMASCSTAPLWRVKESEVVRGAGPTTRVINTYSDFPKQTAFFYRGLFELYTTSRVSQISRNFMADLNAFFPLKKGDRHSVQYVSIKSDEVPGSTMTMKLEVAGEEEITLGDCRCDVLVVKHVIEKDKKEIDGWSALYSPELEMTLAKRYAEGTAQEAIVRYTNIFPLVLR